ncbi:hypothetical protein TNCV_2305151 [Trichonephila clavipes]|nr:hypothetical protein TNCV_2305151 [Trichonephila clavipes]
MTSRWCGMEVRRRGFQLRCRPRHLTMVQNYEPGGQGNGLVEACHEFDPCTAEEPPYRGGKCSSNLSRLRRFPVGGVVGVERGCQLKCHPRHLTVVEDYEVRREKPSNR